MPTANYKGTLKNFPSCGKKMDVPPNRTLRNEELPSRYFYKVRLAGKNQKNTVEYTKTAYFYWGMYTCGEYYSGGWGKRARKYICQECAQKLGWEW